LLFEHNRDMGRDLSSSRSQLGSDYEYIEFRGTELASSPEEPKTSALVTPFVVQSEALGPMP
jgi:hypothetical protein